MDETAISKYLSTGLRQGREVLRRSRHQFQALVPWPVDLLNRRLCRLNSARRLWSQWNALADCICGAIDDYCYRYKFACSPEVS
jgi:hypothetical protein